MKKDSIGNIINKIKSDNIKPDSKLKAEWKNYAYWSGLVFVSVLGALFFALIIANLIGLDSFRYLGFGKFIHFMIVSAPYFWISLCFIAIILAVISFRKTRLGYRAGSFLLITLTVLIISVLGTLLHISNAGSKVNDKISQKAPGFQRNFVLPKEERVMDSKNGVLVGDVVGVQKGVFDIKTTKEGVWKIELNPKTRLPKRVEIKRGMRIVVFGNRVKQGVIRADAIKLFGSPGCLLDGKICKNGD